MTTARQPDHSRYSLRKRKRDPNSEFIKPRDSYPYNLRSRFRPHLDRANPVLPVVREFKDHPHTISVDGPYGPVKARRGWGSKKRPGCMITSNQNDFKGAAGNSGTYARILDVFKAEIKRLGISEAQLAAELLYALGHWDNFNPNGSDRVKFSIDGRRAAALFLGIGMIAEPLRKRKAFNLFLHVLFQIRLGKDKKYRFDNLSEVFPFVVSARMGRAYIDDPYDSLSPGVKKVLDAAQPTTEKKRRRRNGAQNTKLSKQLAKRQLYPGNENDRNSANLL